MHAARWKNAVFALASAALAAGCMADFAGLPKNGGGTPPPPGPPPAPATPPPPPPPPPPPVVPRVTSIVISHTGPDTMTSLDDKAQFTAEARDQFGFVMPGQSFNWSLDSTGVVRLDQGSVTITATDNGTAVLRASAAGVSAAVMVVVNQRVSKVEVSPGSRELDQFESVDLVARAFDVRNHLVTRPLVCAWTASRDYTLLLEPDTQDPTRVKVTRVLTGRTTVTATVEGKSDDASIR